MTNLIYKSINNIGCDIIYHKEGLDTSIQINISFVSYVSNVVEHMETK